MKVLQVITGLQRAAGTSVFCGEIANQLVANGHECIIVLPYINQEEKYQVDARVKVISKAELKKSKWVPDVVHIHGLWSPQLHFMVQLAKQYKTPIVWSPHGMLAPWALRHKWFKKKLSWVLWQKRDLQRAKLFHVTSSEESQWIHSLGFSQSTSIVPLGTSMPRRGAQHDITIKTILFVGRIYPVKGLVNLIKAFAMLRKDAQWSDWRVVIVGPNQAGHQEELESLAQELGLVTVRDSYTSNSVADILFTGALFGVEKDNAYRSASCFVLPSFTENFGGVVIDALSFGVPVLASVATPWG
ncbi:MAG: glycosyltransferase, partial [Kiritimatiellia bacterium]